MASRLSRDVVDHRRLIVVLGLIAVVVAAIFGGGVASRLTNRGFTDPDSKSATAERLLAEEFGSGEPNLVLMVMRRPARFAVSITPVLGLLAVPFLDVELGVADDRVLPADSPVRSVQDGIRQDFASREASALQVVATDIGPSTYAAGTSTSTPSNCRLSMVSPGSTLSPEVTSTAGTCSGPRPLSGTNPG